MPAAASSRCWPLIFLALVRRVEPMPSCRASTIGRTWRDPHGIAKHRALAKRRDHRGRASLQTHGGRPAVIAMWLPRLLRED